MRPIAVLLVALVAGCEMPRTTCAVLGEVSGVDVDGDGRADLRTLMRDGRERCRELDLDHNGRPDVLELRDSGGGLVWQASDFDGDGRADQVELHTGADARHRLIDLDADARPDLLVSLRGPEKSLELRLSGWWPRW